MEQNPWRPLSELPKRGSFLFAIYAPTSWQFYIQHIKFGPNLDDHQIAFRLKSVGKYAVAWCYAPPAPPDDFRA